MSSRLLRVAALVACFVCVTWLFLEYWAVSSDAYTSSPLLVGSPPGRHCRFTASSDPLPFFPANGPANLTLPRSATPPLNVRLIFAGKYGRFGGLWMDVAIYHDLLVSMGHVVEVLSLKEQPVPVPGETCVADVQIFYETIFQEWLDVGRYNMFVVNHEIKHELHLYRYLNAVVCKTRIAKKLVDNYVAKSVALDGLNVPYIGHTSVDLVDQFSSQPKSTKDFTQFIHVGGKSINKGTEVLYRAWRSHPEWPMLHLIDFKFSDRYFRKQHIVEDLPYNQQPNRTGLMVQSNLILYTNRLSDAELYRLQQNAGVHLCPSREEGFGHYINEARAFSSLVMTTDWSPMNELVQKEFGVLIPCKVTTQSLYQSPFPDNTACYVRPEGLEQAMKTFLDLRKRESSNKEGDLLGKMGLQARKRYEQDHNAFKKRFYSLFRQIAEQQTR